MARGDEVIVRYCPEVSYGVTPTNALTWQTMRVTGEDLAAEPNTDQSEELSGTERGITDIAVTGHNVSGGVQFELSATNFDDMLEALFGGTWAADVLIPANTKRSFTFEKEFDDLNKFITYTGMSPGSLSLSFASRSKVTGSVGFVGAAAATGATSLVGTGTDTPAAATAIMRCGSAITAVNYGGATAASQGIRIKSVELSIEQEQTPDEVIDADAATGMELGTFNVSVSIEAYFDDVAVYQDVLDGTDRAFDFTIDNGTNSYIYEFPALIFTGGGPQGAAKNTGLNQSLTASATLKGGAGYSMKITRT